MNLDNLPIRILEEVELAVGEPIDDLFKPDNKSPYRKRAIAYLTAKSNGVAITWEEMADKTVAELVQIMESVQDDPKANW